MHDKRGYRNHSKARSEGQQEEHRPDRSRPMPQVRRLGSTIAIQQ